MKKILMTMVAAFAAVSMNAQNDMYVGGSLGFSTTSYDGNNMGNTFKILPEVGMKLDENWGIGVVVGYSNTKRTKEATGTVDLNSNAFTIAPYVRYTAFTFGNVNIFADGIFQYVSGNDESAKAGSAVDNKYNTWGLAIQPGVAYNISDNFSLVAKFGSLVGYSSYKPDGGEATNTFSLLDLKTTGLSFGFYYNF